MSTPQRRSRRHEQIKLLTVEERRDKAAEILAVGVLRLLAKDGRVKEATPGTDIYEDPTAAGNRKAKR